MQGAILSTAVLFDLISSLVSYDISYISFPFGRHTFLWFRGNFGNQPLQGRVSMTPIQLLAVLFSKDLQIIDVCA